MQSLSEMFRYLTVGVVVLDACYYTHWAWQRRKAIPAKVQQLRQRAEVVLHRATNPTVRHPGETREGEVISLDRDVNSREHERSK